MPQGGRRGGTSLCADAVATPKGAESARRFKSRGAPGGRVTWSPCHCTPTQRRSGTSWRVCLEVPAGRPGLGTDALSPSYRGEKEEGGSWCGVLAQPMEGTRLKSCLVLLDMSISLMRS